MKEWVTLYQKQKLLIKHRKLIARLNEKKKSCIEDLLRWRGPAVGGKYGNASPEERHYLSRNIAQSKINLVFFPNLRYSFKIK